MSSVILSRQETHRKKSKPRGIVTFQLLALAALPTLLVFGMEWIQRGSPEAAWSWILASPKPALLNMLLAELVVLMLYGLLGSLVPAAGTAALLLFVMALVNYFKTMYIGEPFYPWDVFLKRETFNILPLVTGQEALRKLGIVGAVVVLIFSLRFLLPRFRIGLAARAGLLAVSLLGLHSFGIQGTWASQLLYKMDISEITWNQQQNYEQNGISLAFAMNVKNAIVSAPEGYSETAIAALAQDIQADTMNNLTLLGGTSGGIKQQPNVIFIMNEAFWDPTLLPDVTFSEDPMPTVHRLQQESTSGYLLSPQFGGGTSNVEYEVLTGQSMSFLPGGSVPYQQYIHKPLPSLASYFEEQGYNSLGIHSYEGWFWNREQVYEQLGFQRFISKDQFDNPEYNGAFIADDEVSRRIIEEVDGSDKPAFIYAVTMQNHGPYDDQRYGTADIQTEGPLTPDAKDTLETYTQGVRDADRSLQLLIDHFEQSGEPTVIVFFGDHLPMLGLNYDVYQQGGFIQDSDTDTWSLEELQRMHSVPFVMWSNLDLPKEQVPALSNSFLGAYVLDMLQMDKKAPFSFTSVVMRSTPGLLRNLVVDAQGQLYRTVPAEQQGTVDQYRALQYDQLFGKQYLAKFIDTEFLTRTALPGYNADLKSERSGTDEAQS